MKPDAEDMEKIAKVEEGKVGWMSKINCCKKKEVDAESMGTDAEAGFRKVSAAIVRLNQKSILNNKRFQV